MSEAHCELVIAGVIARDSLQLHSPAAACEVIIGGAVASSPLEFTGSSAPNTSQESEHGEQPKASDLIDLSIAHRVQIEEQVTASDSVQAVQGVTQNQGEPASAADSVHISVQHRIELLETIAAADSHQAKQHASVTLLAAVFASDTLKAGQDALIYTAKTDSLALSVLIPEAPINSLALVQGELAASGSEGLYRFTGKPAAPFIQTGWLTPEGGALWRAEACYLQHSGAPLTLHLAISDGSEQTYRYTTAPRSAHAPVPSKLTLGRGLRTRALRIGLSGEAFMLDGGALILNPLSRKY